MTRIALAAYLVCAVASRAHARPADDPPKFELLDGDRVAFIGGTFIERDQAYGYLETMLTARWPDRNITFRNLGWSGDTVWGEARAGFGSAEDGFRRLKEQVEAVRPTVLFIAYGANEAFDGEAGLPKFEQGLNRLLDMLVAASAPNARFVMLSPSQQERGRGIADPTSRNRDIQKYTELIGRAAATRGFWFINLYSALNERQRNAGGPISEFDGQFGGFAYWHFSIGCEQWLGLDQFVPDVRIAASGEVKEVRHATVSSVITSDEKLKFESVDRALTVPARPAYPRPNYPPRHISGEVIDTRPMRFYRFQGLKPGRYELRADGAALATYSDEDWDKWQTIRGPEVSQVEQLRQAIIEKNRLYFHRWRPQNETYLFGFRKHEQGNNAVEVPKFDELVEEQEKRIAKLRVPVKHTYELIRQD